MESKKVINVGIIGTGSMGRTHSFSIASLPYFYSELPFKANLFGVYTRNAEKLDKFHSDFGFSKKYGSEDEMIADPEIDVIDICTPNICHFDTIMKALKNNKNIYCEKPLVISRAQAEEVLVETMQHPNLVNAVVFNIRFLPAILKAKQLIEDGKLGRIIAFRCSYLHNSNMNLNKNAGWKQDADICGGGVLFDLGSHAIDLLKFLTSLDIVKISGKSQIAFPVRKGMNGGEWQTNADEAFYMTAILENGATGTLEASKIAVGANDDLSFEMYGEKGSLKFSLMQPNFLKFYDNTIDSGKNPDQDYGGEKGYKDIECVQRYPSPGGIFPGIKAPIGWLRSHIHSIYTYLDGVCKGKLNELSPSFTEGCYVQNVMEAAYKSDRSGVWEDVE